MLNSSPDGNRLPTAAVTERANGEPRGTDYTRDREVAAAGREVINNRRVSRRMRPQLFYSQVQQIPDPTLGFEDEDVKRRSVRPEEGHGHLGAFGLWL